MCWFRNPHFSYPVSPSTVSSMGRTWTLFPYLTSGQAWMLQNENMAVSKTGCQHREEWQPPPPRQRFCSIIMLRPAVAWPVMWIYWHLSRFVLTWLRLPTSHGGCSSRICWYVFCHFQRSRLTTRYKLYPFVFCPSAKLCRLWTTGARPFCSETNLSQIIEMRFFQKVIHSFLFQWNETSDAHLWERNNRVVLIDGFFHNKPVGPFLPP